MINVEEYEIKDDDSKISAAQKEVDLKTLVQSTYINRGESFLLAQFKRKVYAKFIQECDIYYRE